MQHGFQDEVGDFECDINCEQAKDDDEDWRDVAVDVHVQAVFFRINRIVR